MEFSDRSQHPHYHYDNQSTHLVTLVCVEGGLIGGNGPFGCATTADGTSCSLLRDNLRVHSTFHQKTWKLIPAFLDQFWNLTYCSAHASWLQRYLRVLHHLATNGVLPLGSSNNGLSRWLRRQLTVLRKVRFRFSCKSAVNRQGLNSQQIALLRALVTSRQLYWAMADAFLQNEDSPTTTTYLTTRAKKHGYRGSSLN